MNVLVCSTSGDLHPYREHLCEKVGEWWTNRKTCPTIRTMDNAAPDSKNPVNWSIQQVIQADAVLLLLGKRHGDLANDPDLEQCGLSPDKMRERILLDSAWQKVQEPRRFSFTQWEALAALAANKPLFVFTPDKNSKDVDLQHYWQYSTEEGEEKLQRQKAFAAWVDGQTRVAPFESRSDLGMKARECLENLLRRRNMFRVAASFLAAMVVVAALLVFRPAPPPLSPKLDLLIRDPHNAERYGYLTAMPNLAPLQSDDQVRIEAKVNRPAYLYLLWIGSDGKLMPLFPWRPGEWGSLPNKQSTVEQVKLPLQPGEFWPLESGTGTETLLVLAGDEPLENDDALRRYLADFSPRLGPNDPSLLAFADGEPSRNREGGGGINLKAPVSNTILATQSQLQSKLTPLGLRTNVICVARENRG